MEFNIGDLLWIHLRKYRFAPGKYGKFKQWAYGPFKVLEKIRKNAYKLELPARYDISPTFNLKDIRSFLTDEHKGDLRTSLFSQPYGIDTEVSPSDEGMV